MTTIKVIGRNQYKELGNGISADHKLIDDHHTEQCEAQDIMTQPTLILSHKTMK